METTEDIKFADIHMNIKGILSFRTHKTTYHFINVRKLASVSLGVTYIDIGDGKKYRCLSLGRLGSSFDRQIDHLPAAVAEKIHAEIIHFQKSN